MTCNFSLIFGGTFPHYFYTIVERFLAEAGKAKQFYLFLIERFMYAPIYQVVSLYFLSRFEVLKPAAYNFKISL